MKTGAESHKILDIMYKNRQKRKKKVDNSSMKEPPSKSSEPTPIRRRFGNILRKARKVRGKSIYELAREAEVDAGYISRLENAHRNPPSPRILQRFADALDVRADLLMMAAGYLEFDNTGRPLDEEEIVRRVEAELTGFRVIESEMPDVSASSPVKERKEIQDVLRQLDQMKRGIEEALREGPTFEIPILGQIPAGFPVGVEEQIIGKLTVAQQGLPGDPEIFALKVKGDSLTGIGIMEGDYVVISPMLKNALDQGAVCAVRIDDDEVTLKRVYFAAEGVILRSANPEYPDLTRATVSVIGKVVRLVRQY
ncbi:MAG TPA: XRE family transcriptional regulator, partial [Firmicutes bacterium]|nr:XRE family transcriptional regulator [Bacillota bacterium]